MSWLLPMLVLFALPGVAQDSDPDVAAPEVEVVYDPYRGMGGNGRTPRIAKAALVEKPEQPVLQT